MRYLRLGAVLVYSLLIVHSLLFIVFADEGISKAEAAKQKPATGKKAFFAELKDKVKITGSLYEYFIYQKNVYFNRLKADQFWETTLRLGAEYKPVDDLVFNFGVLGEGVAGDTNEYTVPARHDWKAILEFANFKVNKLFGQPLSLTAGRQNLEFGDGFLIYDFYSDRRAVWTASMRSLYATLLTYEPRENIKIDAFAGEVERNFKSYEVYLKDAAAYNGKRNIYGLNTHYAGKKGAVWDLGLLYKSDASQLHSDTFVLSLRTSTPVPLVPNLTFEAEVVPEWGKTMAQNGGFSTTNPDNKRVDRRAIGGHVDIVYALKDKPMSPYTKLCYRYLPGDNPNTDKKNEAFDPMFYGFRNWGQWCMGSINGFNLFNSNEKAWMLEFGISPTKTILARLMLYDFSLDRENNPDARKRFSREANLVFDWFPNDCFFCGAEFGFAHPLKAGRVYAGSDDNTMEVVSWIGLKF